MPTQEKMKRDEVRKKLVELDTRKKEIEAEAKSYQEVLNAYPKILDNEGFPLPNVPHELVANAKHKLACLKTDYKNIMSEIESYLPYAF